MEEFSKMVERLQEIRVSRLRLESDFRRTPSRELAEALQALDREESEIRNSRTFKENRSVDGL